MSVQSPVKIDLVTTPTVETLAAPPKTIFDTIPLGLVLSLAKPYLAGESPQQAIRRAHELYTTDKYCSTLDILGEDATNDDDCEASVVAYQTLIDAIKADSLKSPQPREQMSVSMKPSMFSTTFPQANNASKAALEKAFDRIMRVVEYAMKSGVRMTLEAEDHRWTNFHLESYFALVSAGYTNLGTVLQSRLFRTEQDFARFDERMRVRLVIGIYNEPSQIAHTDKREMKDLLVKYAGKLLEQGCYVELATHDTKCIENFYRQVAIPQKVAANRWSVAVLRSFRWCLRSCQQSSQSQSCSHVLR